MTHIYLIDDSVHRHLQLLNDLLPALNHRGIRYTTDTFPENDEEAIKHVRASVCSDSIWKKISTADKNSIFLVDLNFPHIDEGAAFNELKESLENEVSEWKTQAQNSINDAISKKWPCVKHKTALVACAVLRARGIPAILISTAALDAAIELSEQWELPIAQANKRTCWPAWQTRILELERHDDSTISGLLGLYGAKVAEDRRWWSHDQCQAEDSKKAGAAIWEISVFDDGTNKAFHSRNDPKTWVVQESPSRPISKAILEKAVERLRLGCRVDYEIGNGDDESSRFYFPVEPGITFLLSLRELVVAINEPKPLSLIFRKSEDDLHSVEIVLDKSKFTGLNQFFLKFLRGDWKANNTFAGRVMERIPVKGSAQAIFNLGHCRLGGIRGDEEWVQMFRNGSQNWVAWPSIGKQGIIFNWAVGRL